MVRCVCSSSLLLSFLILLFAAPGRAQTAPAQSSAPSSTAPQVDPKVTAIAKDWLYRIQTANVDRSQLTDQMSAALTPSLVQHVAAQLAPLGDPTTVVFVGSKTVQGVTVYQFVLTFKTATVNELVGIDSAGKIAGLRFTPAQQPNEAKSRARGAAISFALALI
jgi:hypothetical protein